MPKTIYRFSGPYRFLSNFYGCNIEIGGIMFPSVEHAFQAMKTNDRGLQINISNAPTPGDAKAIGRGLVLRDDWEDIKVMLMEILLLAKFNDPVLRTKLINTGDAILIEGNTWGDTYWGVCRGKGENKLGKLLMKLRDEFIEMKVAVIKEGLKKPRRIE